MKYKEYLMNLLQTKLNKPPIFKAHITRENINHLLADYKQHKIILVSAPAGSGKSTVINTWLDTIDANYSWYSIDESDNDILQFLSYFIACLETNNIYKSYQLSSLLTSFQSVGADSLIHSVISVLYESKLPFIIGLDDYHLIQNHDIHQMMMKLVEHLPNHIQLVIITREDPPLSLSKLRVGRLLLEIRAKELRFNNDECVQFLAKTMGLKLASSDILTLNEKTEGWIAGLQLAALSLQNHTKPEELIESFAGNHYIVDYLLEEVLNHLDQESIDFLLATSILSQFTADLCDSILDLKRGSSKEHIEVLSRINAFIIPLDHQMQWFRYHHLFRELLLDRLPGTEFDAQELHYRASLWFNTRENFDLAIDHAIEAGAIDLAADIVENIWGECDRSMKAMQWLDKFQNLSKEVIEKRPVLLMGYGWALLDTGKHIEAEKWLKKAQDLYDSIQSGEITDYDVSDQEQYDLLPSTIASAYCYITIGQGQFDIMFNYAKKAFNHKTKMPTHRSGVLHMLMGLAHWSIGDMPQARQEIDSAIIDLKKNKSAIEIGTYEIVKIELLMDAGQFDQASNLLDQVISNALNTNKPPLALANFHLIYSSLYLATGNIHEAIKAHEVSKTYGVKYCLPDFWYKWYQQQATLQVHQDLLESAISSLDEAEAHYYLNPLITRTSLKGLRGYIYVLLGRLNDASFSFDNLFAEQDLIYQSIYLKKTGDHLAADRILKTLYEITKSQQRERSTTEVLLGQAVLARLDGQIDTCIKYMKSATIFINEHFYVEPLLRYQDVLGDVYSKLNLKDEVKQYLSVESLEDSYIIFQVNQQLPEPLTSRELEIIQLLAVGYSNQEVCDQLFLALSTVKGYNQNIYGKLGVRRRTEAISKARTIGLIL